MATPGPCGVRPLPARRGRAPGGGLEFEAPFHGASGPTGWNGRLERGPARGDRDSGLSDRRCPPQGRRHDERGPPGASRDPSRIELLARWSRDMTIDHDIMTVTVPTLQRLVARGQVWTRVAEE